MSHRSLQQLEFLTTRQKSRRLSVLKEMPDPSKLKAPARGMGRPGNSVRICHGTITGKAEPPVIITPTICKGQREYKKATLVPEP
jgi:hypothetical protein